MHVAKSPYRRERRDERDTTGYDERDDISRDPREAGAAWLGGQAGLRLPAARIDITADGGEHPDADRVGGSRTGFVLPDFLSTVAEPG